MWLHLTHLSTCTLCIVYTLHHHRPHAGDDIHILQTPTHFFNALQHGIRSSTSRITVGALYLGTGPGLEAELLDTLACAAQRQPETGVEINLFYDALRATRPSRDRLGNVSSTARDAAERLLCAVPEGAATGPAPRVSLYHTPVLRGILKRCALPCDVMALMVRSNGAHCGC